MQLERYIVNGDFENWAQIDRKMKKTVLITGAGSGIGESIAKVYAGRGASLLLTGLVRDDLERVAQQCRQAGADTRVFPLDLEDTETIDALAAFVKEERIVPDIYVLNAGISQRAKAFDSTFEVDRKLMNVNFFGHVYLIKSLAWLIRQKSDVQIAVVTSISGLFGFPLRSAYCASKHALFGFFESLDLENPNIKVTFLIPGRIRTQISKSAILGDGGVYGKMDQGQEQGMDVDRCGRIAVRAIDKRKHRKLIGGKELLMAYIHKYSLRLFYTLAGKISST